MPLSSDIKEILNAKVDFFVGDSNTLARMDEITPLLPFADNVVDFLNDLSKELLSIKSAKSYSDVITFGFWIRKANVLKIKTDYMTNDKYVKIGRGVAFHIAPSNVPVNYAYSMVTGLLTGNANIVRIPSKDFPQVNIINNAISKVLDFYSNLKSYICLVRYGRDNFVNDVLSGIADVRIIWGGDSTIEEIRKSLLKPRATEVTFADRYSLAVIDSDTYLDKCTPQDVAKKFYDDTYFTDQNACTSPRVVVWMGSRISEAKNLFWQSLYDFTKKIYNFQDIQGINKLSNAYVACAKLEEAQIEARNDNLLFRVKVNKLESSLMEYRGNSGFFYEYDCKDIMELRDLCSDTHCQTLSYIGDKQIFMKLLSSGVKGVDRIVPVGKTMDFSFIWDGYNLVERLTRAIKIE